ncbi:MAG: endonuclease/exonuclease/phosphatase family protein [Rhodoglobus sp.]|uniref:endonuclease/exonuclease/phosphatase family protein n=1 Tax=Salinibacterium sp. G-O1 TaxID=3046208 RepID=UPI0024BA12D0|nr:endonuclease/exonuclease/phosphatase family protein [Salinibacterium sp. G-O1]MDJ0335072.1 endonuclease/exonuclease/phosphatase family protein [Salinibacterium sp. G-O1]
MTTYAWFMVDSPLIGPIDEPELHVMTYNIRRRMPRPRRADRWTHRAPALLHMLSTEQPTILGVQEALPDQSDFIGHSLGSHYRWVGSGRDADGTGEACPIFYDARRVELQQWRQVALSDTPRVPGSRSWGNRIPRILVWALFADLATGTEFRMLNTHLDHQSRRSRVRAAGMVRQLVDASIGPAIVTGDFNTSIGTTPYSELVLDGKLLDAWVTAGTQLTPAWGTYPNYRPPTLGRKRIDWILTNGGVDVRAIGINPATLAGVVGSDHLPVQARVVLTPR